jgi:nucleotide-binding universal stress UspA family protein
LQLQPLRYEYKPDNALGLKSSGEHIGFSAQAVEKIVPEAVTRNDKGYLLVNNDPIMWTMLNAIKEQQAQIDQQQKQLNELKQVIQTQQTVKTKAKRIPRRK